MIENNALAKKMVEKQNYEDSLWIKKLFSGFKTEGGQSMKSVSKDIASINKTVIKNEC